MRYTLWTLVFCLLLGLFAFADEATYKMAVKAYLKKDYTKAIELFKKHAEETPDPGTYYLIGYAYYKLKQQDKANEYFKEAYLLDPKLDTTKLMSELGRDPRELRENETDAKETAPPEEKSEKKETDRDGKP